MGNDYIANSVTVTGTVVEIIYANEENGYVVCEIDSTTEGMFTATGYLPYICEGENIEMTGKWVTHPEYGEQFSVLKYTTVLPAEKNSILMYLSSGIIPGIREATAKKIVEKFDTDVFNIMLNYPERLSEIKGITKEKALKFGQEFQKTQALSGIVIFLQQFNVSAKAAAKVHKILGSDAVEKIKKNPYVLSDNVDGITFKTADNIAHIMGLPKNLPERICSYVKYTLTQAAYRYGHAYLPKTLILEYVVRELGVTGTEAEDAITRLNMEKDVFADTVDDCEVYYLTSVLSSELYVARRICSLAEAEQKFTVPAEKAQKLINEIAAKEGLILAKEQQEATVTAVTNGCMVITGGPGTGKTTTINTIIQLMQYLKLDIVLAAPTGRAAKRMSEVTGLEAKTIHRLLGVVKNDNDLLLTFTKNEENPLKADVVIVDEVSMLDINLTASLLRAVKPGAKLILVGDADQLPSVGPGNVLRDIINSEVVPVIKLEHIFRQAQESMIVVNAHRINKGLQPLYDNSSSNFFFMPRNGQIMVKETVSNLYKNRLPAAYNINPVSSVQVLSPSRKGMSGTIELNAAIQQDVNPPDYMKAEVSHGKTIFRTGDKVMQIKNNYDIEWVKENGEEGCGIFNGDIGIIRKISAVDKILEIVFDDDKIVEYNFSGLDELELAYAITVHKSQGNEFAYVIIAVSNFSNFLMFRNLLYTAVTRAKQMVILVGSEKCIEAMIKNNERTKRYSGLLEKIKLIKQLTDEK